MMLALPRALLLVAIAAPAMAGPEEDAAAARIEEENRTLRLRAELAESEGAYLVLDTTARTLRILLKGAVLREVPVQRIDLGTPEVLFVNREAGFDLTSRIWTAGRLDPPPRIRREEIDAVALEAELQAESEPEGDEEVAIPPLPEEAVPAPPRYRLRFEGGLSLEVTCSAAPEIGRVASALAALASDRDSLRLRIVLDVAASGALYRSLPEESRLLVAR